MSPKLPRCPVESHAPILVQVRGGDWLWLPHLIDAVPSLDSLIDPVPSLDSLGQACASSSVFGPSHSRCLSRPCHFQPLPGTKESQSQQFPGSASPSLPRDQPPLEVTAGQTAQLLHSFSYPLKMLFWVVEEDNATISTSPGKQNFEITKLLSAFPLHSLKSAPHPALLLWPRPHGSLPTFISKCPPTATSL